MHRAALVGVVVVMFMGSGAAQARVVAQRELTTDQILKLQQSEQRLLVYDHALHRLEVMRERHLISRREYGYEEHDLVAFIGAEADYQNDLMTKDSSFPSEAAREVIENVEKYTTLAVAGIGYLALKCAPGLADLVH